MQTFFILRVRVTPWRDPTHNIQYDVETCHGMSNLSSGCTISRREDSNGKVCWYENKSGIWARHELGTSDEMQLGAVASDINGDSYPDLIVARFWFENPKVLNHFPDSVWIRRSYAGGLSNENHDIAAYDFDRDGKEEILCYSQTFADIVMPAGWFKNPGKDTDGVWEYQPWPFRVGIVPNLYGISSRSWVVDIDSDGDQDVVFTDCDVEGSKGYLFINKQNGSHFIRLALPSPGDPTGSFHSLAVADFDNDGDLYIFTGEQEDPDKGMKPAFLKERGYFWENTGDSRKPAFVVRIIQTDNPGWHDVQIGDVDGD